MRRRAGMAVAVVVIVAVIVIVIVVMIVAMIVVMAGAFVAMAVGRGGLALRGAAASAGGVVMPVGRSRGLRAAAGVRLSGSGGIGVFVRCARHRGCLFVSR